MLPTVAVDFGGRQHPARLSGARGAPAPPAMSPDVRPCLISSPPPAPPAPRAARQSARAKVHHTRVAQCAPASERRGGARAHGLRVPRRRGLRAGGGGASCWLLLAPRGRPPLMVCVPLWGTTPAALRPATRGQGSPSRRRPRTQPSPPAPQSHGKVRSLPPLRGARIHGQVRGQGRLAAVCAAACCLHPRERNASKFQRRAACATLAPLDVVARPPKGGEDGGPRRRGGGAARARAAAGGRGSGRRHARARTG